MESLAEGVALSREGAERAGYTISLATIIRDLAKKRLPVYPRVCSSGGSFKISLRLDPREGRLPSKAPIETRDGVQSQGSAAPGCPLEEPSIYQEHLNSITSPPESRRGCNVIPPEIVVGVSLRFYGAEDSMPPLPGSCVLDTAAGGSYLLVPSIPEFVSVCHIDPYRINNPIVVSLADGARVRVEYGIRCNLSLSDVSGNVVRTTDTDIRLLVCRKAVLTPSLSILAGRSLLQEWDMVIVGSLAAYVGRNFEHCVYEAPIPGKLCGIHQE